jgi:hypothetical protein
MIDFVLPNSLTSFSDHMVDEKYICDKVARLSRKVDKEVIDVTQIFYPRRNEKSVKNREALKRNIYN